MTKSSQINYSNLEKSLSKQLKKVYKLSEVRDKIEKVAFDVVRFVDSQSIDDLWRIEHSHDGDYIVAMYDENLKSEASAPNPWECLASDNIYVFYKSHPIAKLGSADLGIPKEEFSLVKRYLPNKLASDKNFAHKLISKSLLQEQQNEVYSKFPELA